MVSWLLLASLAGAPGAPGAPAPVGVIQSGDCRVRTGSVAAARAGGHLVRRGDQISTSATGWVELSLRSAARVRLSASTSLGVSETQDSLQLPQGRVWVQRDASGPTMVALQVPGMTLRLPRASSVVVEHTRSAGSFVVVRAGQIRVRLEDQEITVAARQTLRRAPGMLGLPTPRAGGSALSDLVAGEARRARSDPSGLQDFLLSRAREAAPERGGASRANPPLRGSSDVIGADSGAAGLLVEDGLRPPPFFEEEVPTKGPNLDVQVRF